LNIWPPSFWGNSLPVRGCSWYWGRSDDYTTIRSLPISGDNPDNHVTICYKLLSLVIATYDIPFEHHFDSGGFLRVTYTQ